VAPVKVIHSSITLRINKEAEGSAVNYSPGKTRSEGRGLTPPLCAMHVADRWKIRFFCNFGHFQKMKEA
jgi:hypothetical protein